jgi:glucose/arabinose dehydrogenase
VRLVLGGIAAALVAVSCASAGTQGSKLGLRAAYKGLNAPIYVAAAPGEPNNLYIVEQPGLIRVAIKGKLRAKPFLDVRRSVSYGGEQGLLSMAFHPNYVKNHKYYVNYTDRNGDTRVIEYSAKNYVSKRVREILFVDQPYPNHNGGQLQFGPDGKLYVGMGDGGSAGDPENHAQDLSSRLGKLLRINVAGRKPAIGISAYGLRNPWRFSFDRATGDLWIGDVGQDTWEEIDYTPRVSPGVENYGWDVYEGNHPYENKPPNPAGNLVSPVAEYRHGSDGCSVTGGYVWKGRYYYGDYCSGKVWTLRLANGKVADKREESINVPSLSAFGLDGHGNLYAVSLKGTVYRIVG